MGNPLYQMMGGTPQRPGNSPVDMLQRFQQFQSQFRGDPRQMVQQLMASGKMSQAQFNQLSQLANQLYPRFK